MSPVFAGAARRVLPDPDPRSEMLGWGMPHGRCRKVHTALQVRALVLHDAERQRTLAMVVHELCMVSHAVRLAVLAGIQALRPDGLWSEDTLLIGANHTHAGPGGYTHDLFYTLTNPGYEADYFDALVQTTVQALASAWDARDAARLSLGRATFSDNDPVVRNRAPIAYARNRTALPPLDREKNVLRVVFEDGTPAACVDFFGVHGTCVHHDSAAVHPDNKGMAARALEDHAAASWGAPGFVALFFQGAAGDVSPNTRYDRDRGLVVGHLDDDFAHADWHGRVQAQVARTAWESATLPLDGPLDGALLYLDFDGLPVDADLADGHPRRTAHGLVGLSFIQGTAEGPGPLCPFRGLIRRLALAKQSLKPVPGQGGKLPFCEVGRGRKGVAFGFLRMSPPLVPGLDPVVKAVARLTDNGGMGDAPWIANRQPAQLLRIGPLAIITVAGEPTTHAGRLLRHTTLRALRGTGIEEVVVCGYANAFSGYVTTAAEYATQGYEGGHTLFGPHTLAGWRTGARRLARRLAVPADQRPTDRGPRPIETPDSVLANRRFPIFEPPA